MIIHIWRRPTFPQSTLMLRRPAENAPLLEALFDANLSPKLVSRLVELFPDSAHVFDTGLARSTEDAKIWEFARANKFTIVTADSDFLHLARTRGVPPKIVRLENCNYRTARVEDLLRGNAIRISELEQSSAATLMIRDTR
jgi:predicted nuclease of predicted toxin-antitoxin system